MADTTHSAPHAQGTQAEEQEVDLVESVTEVIPWVLPSVGALLIFMLAFIAVTMA